MKENRQKNQFSNLFIFLILILMTLPFFMAGQDAITRFLDFSGLSQIIQKYIIPAEVKVVIVILSLLRIPAFGDERTIVLTGGVEMFKAQIIWSCIGWQSMLLAIVSVITGIRGNYTLSSKVETIVIGIMGTFWINILRLVSVYVLGFWMGKFTAVLFHNFAGTIIVFSWLFVFWWFSYRFILEEKTG